MSEGSRAAPYPHPVERHHAFLDEMTQGTNGGQSQAGAFPASDRQTQIAPVWHSRPIVSQGWLLSSLHDDSTVTPVGMQWACA